MLSPQSDFLVRHASLRQLQVFETVARHGGYTRAAEALHLTQPTVSMQIKKLAEVIGLPLFEQVGKRMHLTAAGEALHGACREVFDTLGRLEMTMADMKGLKQGRLRLAVVTTIEYFVPRVLGEFCEHNPGVDIELEVTNRKRLLARLAANQDDLYILGQPPKDMELESRPLLPNPLVVLARRGHPLANTGNISLQRLLEEPIILREPGSGTRKAALELFAEHDLEPKVRMELGSNEAIKQAVAGGLGIAVLSRHTLSLEGDAGPLVVLDVEGFPLRRQWHLVYPKGKQLSVVTRAFYDFLLGRGDSPRDSA